MLAVFCIVLNIKICKNIAYLQIVYNVIGRGTHVKFSNKPGVVAHICNPSSLGG